MEMKRNPYEDREHIGRRKFTNKVRLMHSESPKERRIENIIGSQKKRDATSTPALLLPTTFDRRFHPLARWETSYTFFANFDKPFVTGVKSGNVDRFRIHLYFAVVNVWWVPANIPCKACDMGP